MEESNLWDMENQQGTHCDCSRSLPWENLQALAQRGLTKVTPEGPPELMWAENVGRPSRLESVGQSIQEDRETLRELQELVLLFHFG